MLIQRFRFNDSRDWFLHKRFGMFIHWGLYAIPAWQEQIIWRGHMPRKEYELFMQKFNPVSFDPEQWLDHMQEAGMEYVCFTTKHHDGFCMWDTAYADYKVTNSPYGKDIVGMLADACHKRKIPFGVYYSIPDWHHNNYPTQGRHHEMFGPRTGDEPDFDLYVAYMENQVRELMTGYGEISQLFWDINVMEYDNTAFNDEVRKLQPSIVINDRGPHNGDFKTPERHLPDGMEFPSRTEAVQSMGRESWGYRSEEDYYSHKYLMQSIDRSMAMGGNYMLNVGPRANGTFDPRDLASMRIIGNWFHRVRESLVGTVPATTIITQATDKMRDEVMLTRNGNTIYVHAYKDLQCSAIILKPLAIMPKRAVLLNDGRKLEAKVELIPSHHRERPYLRIREIPVNEFIHEPIVIRLDFDDSVNA